MTIYETIHNEYDNLSKSEKKIAKFCLDNYSTFPNNTLAELSRKANCGEATIFRFCHKLGIKSFHELKKLIEEELNATYNPDNNLLNEIYQSIRHSLEYTINQTDQSIIDEFCELIHNSNKVFCGGVGNSAVAAKACAMRFLRNGKHATFIEDNHFQLIYLYSMNENDIAILFSISGESLDMIHCAEILRERNVKVISMTSSVVSSLAKLSDYHILTRRWDGQISAGSMIAQITQMYMADVITTRVGMFNPNEVLKAKDTTYKYVGKKG